MQLPIAHSDPVDSQYPVKRTRFFLVFGAGLIVSVLLIITNLVAASSTAHSEGDPFGRMFEVSFGVTWLIATLLPPAIAVAAALMTARYIRLDAYKLASQTDLSNWQLASILVKRVQDTGRDLASFLLGLAPFWVALALFPSGTSCGGGCTYYWLWGSPFNDGLMAILALINAVLLTALAIWSGVWLGLWFRQPLMAAIGAFVLLSTLAIVLIRLYDVLIAIPAEPFNPMPLPWVIGPTLAIYVAVPLILLIVVTFLAAHWARNAN